MSQVAEPNPWDRGRWASKLRRRAKYALAAALVLAVGLLLAVQVRLLPYPVSAPAITVDPRAVGLGLDTRAVAGPLATDPAWLQAVADRVAGPRPTKNGVGVWRATPGLVHPVWAGDLGTKRVAVLWVAYRFGVLASPSVVVMEGPAGARPEEMSPVSWDLAGNTRDVVVVEFSTADGADPATPAQQGLLVLAPDTARVSADVSTAPSFVAPVVPAPATTPSPKPTSTPGKKTPAPRPSPSSPSPSQDESPVHEQQPGVWLVGPTPGSIDLTVTGAEGALTRHYAAPASNG